MNRRHALALLVGAAAGCSSQSSEPTSTPEPTPATETATGTPASTETETTAAEPTETPGTTAGLTGIVATLNDVYADLEPALETLEVGVLDTDALASQLTQVQTDIASERAAEDADTARLQSLSDTRWIFDRIVRTFVRFDEAYALHSQLQSAYDASERTSETTTALDRFKTLATEAANSAGTAASRYDAMDAFDPELDVTYAAFEDQMFRVSDTANALTPFVRGLERAIPARVRYQQAAASYEQGSYRDAQNAFADLLNEFTDARELFEDAEGLSGPLEAPLRTYLCESRAGRLACVEYRAACREQLDGNESRAERRRNQAEQRYTECR